MHLGVDVEVERVPLFAALVIVGRPATAGEVSFYLTLLQNGASDDDLKAAIIGSDEYFKYAGATDYRFQDKLYQDVLDRPLDRGSAATLGGLLAHGTTRQAVAGLVLHSVEALKGAVSVARAGQGFVLSISVTSADPARAARLANAVADAFLVDKLDTRFDAAKRASQWLSDRLVELRNQLREAAWVAGPAKRQRSLRRFRLRLSLAGR